MDHSVRIFAKTAAAAKDELDWGLVDEEDAFLLSDEVAQRPAQVIEGPVQAPAAQAADVTWLRRTEYLGAEQRRQRQSEKAKAAPLDTSHEAQIARIEQGFAAANAPLASLTHPGKPDVHAVDAYELLPDPETWATPMHIVRFTSDLGRPTPGVADRDVRMDTAILRPVADGGGQRVSLYLTSADHLPAYASETSTEMAEPPHVDADAERRQDVAALRYAKRRRLGEFPKVAYLDGEEGDANEYATGFRHVRDLEPLDQTNVLSNQLAIVLDDGTPDAAPELEQVTTHGTVAEQVAKDTDALFDADEAMGEADIGTTLPPQSAAERERQQTVVPQGEGRKVAYYHRIDMRYGLRIRRQRKAEQGLPVPYDGFWHRVIVGNRPASEREVAKRMYARQNVDQLAMDGVEYASSEEEEHEEYEAQEEHEHAENADEHEHDEHEHAEHEHADDHAEPAEPAHPAEPEPEEPASAAETTEQAEVEAEQAEEQGADSDDPSDEQGDASDSDDDDASDVDGDAELAALREEAQGENDAPVEGRRRRRDPTS